LTSTFTTEFGHEYEQERGRWLRRRFLWYAGVSMSLNTFGLLFVVLVIAGLLFFSQMAPEAVDGVASAVTPETMPEEPAAEDEGPSLIESETDQPQASPETEDQGPGNGRVKISAPPAAVAAMLTQMGLTVPAILIAILLYFNAFRKVRRSAMSREELLSLVTRLIIYTGAIGTLSSVLSYELLQWTAPEAYTKMRDEGSAVVIGFNTLLSIMLSHFLASLFLPWTPRESLRPIIPLGMLNLGVTVFYAWGDAQTILVAILFSLVIALPGLLVCWLRTSRFRSKFHFKMVTRRYGEMKTEGRMRYSYEPMRQIGGDYLFAHRVDTGVGEGRGLLVVLLDVTGHGITAALTVNRLQGEIERQVSMDRSVTPGTVLSGLNDYLHHTLARHSVYATALVMRVDPDAGSIVWASAGHPRASFAPWTARSNTSSRRPSFSAQRGASTFSRSRNRCPSDAVTPCSPTPTASSRPRTITGACCGSRASRSFSPGIAASEGRTRMFRSFCSSMSTASGPAPRRTIR